MPEIDVHADDYALTVHTSADMLECMKEGKLNSISIVPNMSCFEECMEMLYKAVPTLPFLPSMSVHLDFVEGKCLAGAKEVPLLVSPDEDMTGVSWGKLFLFSYHPLKRNAVKRQLEKEMKAQIETAWQAIRRCMELAKENQIPCAQKGLRIDSHQHAHMIPVVWEALVEIIAKEEYPVEYIRNSKETLAPFLSEVSLWKTYRPVNFIKNRLLSLYSHKVDRYASAHSMKKMYLWGLVMSGRMDYDRIVRLYPKIAAKAGKENRVLEFCFHPGIAMPEEITAEIGENAARDFYLLSNRRIEKDAVMRLNLFD